MLSADHYEEIRHRAGLIRRTDRAVVAVEGEDRASFLQSVLTNEILSLGPGAGCYAAYLTPQGRMVADMRVLNVGDALWLDVSVLAQPRLIDRLEQSIFSEDVTLTDRSPNLAVLGVYGPQAAGILATVSASASEPDLAGELAHLDNLQSRALTACEARLILVRDDDLNLPGFDLFVAAEDAQTLTAALGEAGAAEVGLETLEVLRVEAGLPVWGAELNDDVIPIEAGIESRAISFTKGCYVGQEVIIRVLHRGHGRVVRRLVGLTIASEQPALRDAAIVAGERESGRVTSSVVSPAVGHPIALGYVHRDFVEPGTRLTIAHSAGSRAAVVTALPFRK